MKTLMLTVIAGTVFGLFAEKATATPPRVVRSNYGHNVFVQRVVATEYVPLPVTVPAYSVGAGIDLTPLIEELRLLRGAVQQLRNGGELADLPPEPEYVGLVRQNCASCHGINPKGNKLSFFHPDGRFKDMTPDVLGNVIAAVSSGAMPKGQKMESADRLKLIAGLTTAPEKASAAPKVGDWTPEGRIMKVEPLGPQHGDPYWEMKRKEAAPEAAAKMPGAK